MHKKYTLIGIILISFLPIFIFTDFGKLSQIPELVLPTIGHLFGLSGAIMLTWQLLLGARGVVSRWIPDLIWVNSIHRFIGTYGFLAICVHPTLMVIYYSQIGLNLISFKLTTPFDYYKTLGTIGFFLLAFVWILSAIIRGRVGFRWWKKFHLLAYVVLPLILIHSLGIGPTVGFTGLRYYWYVLIGIYICILSYRLLFRIGIFRKKYTIKSVNQLTKDVVQINLKPQTKPIKAPLPGQFLYFQPGLRNEVHPFSISHFNPDTHQISITCKAVGPFTKWLLEMNTETTCYLDGPYGAFTQEAYTTNRPIVLIAGGIGITPFVQMVDKLKNGWDKQITLIWGNKTEADIPFRNYMDQVDQANQNFQIVHVLSAQPEYKGETGYITKELLHKYLGQDLNKYEFFVCGPPVMMNMLMPIVEAAGVHTSQIHAEKFSL